MYRDRFDLDRGTGEKDIGSEFWDVLLMVVALIGALARQQRSLSSLGRSNSGAGEASFLWHFNSYGAATTSTRLR